MKVLFVNYNHLDTNNGIHVFNLANHLTHFGVECTVCMPDQNDAAKKIGSALFDIVDFDQARRNNQNRGVDIIHAWTPREAVRLMTEELAKIYNCPYVVHLEDNEESILEATFRRSFAELSRLSCQSLDTIIPPHLSHPLRYKEFLDKACGISVIIDTLQEFCPPALPSEVIWPGYDDNIDWAPPFDAKLQQRLGIGTNEFVVVYTGNVHLSNQQEVSSLYLAIGLLNRRGIRTKIVRTGVDHVQLLNKSLEKDLKEFCINLGHVDRSELPATLSLADILVQPGKADQFNNYRFPSKLPEYFATGKPVLLPAANIGRYLKDGDECILLQQGHALEIAQKLEILFHDNEMRKKTGAAGQHFAEQNLRWDQSAAKLQAFYQRLLASNKLEIAMTPEETEYGTNKLIIDEMIPPEDRIIIGGGDFRTVGEGFKKHFIELGELKRDAKVLDVGCGIGRMAVPLTQYLSRQGEYWGFDIVKDGIDWCAEKITPHFPNFHFHLSDVHNKQYNPNGKYKAIDYKFPYQDSFFDFVFLTSVFTHMLPKDLENYLSEIVRVLKPGGKCFVTYFLLNSESMVLIKQGATSQKFLYEVGDCLTVDKGNPEYALAYPEISIKNLYQKYGLEINVPIQYGNWCYRKEFLSYQDIVVATLSTTTNIITKGETANIQAQSKKSIPILDYATVKDYCDSADHFSQVMRFDGDLKDVQRPWMVKSILGMLPLGAKLLEIGGGEPLVANALQKLGYAVTIVDPYDGSGNGPQTYAQYRRDYPHIRIIKHYFGNDTPSLSEKAFDCIFSISVLEHVPHTKLQDVFKGVSQFLKPGGCSIHCTDLVIAGHMADWHDQGAREMLFQQIKLQNPDLDEDQARQQVNETFKEYYQKMANDLETYYHSAQGHNVWRGKKSYDEFPFRKIVSMQTCVIKIS
jgi:glycosyltransferase involved in cell wall biosynthesis/ubiquinone/menaquinone biosynthesis C-methylase UbiE